MLPRKIADDLMNGRPIEPEAFRGVTIFFSDIVGFTTISQSVQPVDVISLLNQMYTIMDSCASDTNVYKVNLLGSFAATRIIDCRVWHPVCRLSTVSVCRSKPSAMHIWRWPVCTRVGMTTQTQWPALPWRHRRQ